MAWCSPCVIVPAAVTRWRAAPGVAHLWIARDELMIALLNLIDTVIRLYIWVLIASVIMSWLIAFNVINTRNRFIYLVGDFLFRVTEPALRPIRNILPSLGGVDLSPLVLILALYFARDLLWELARGML